MGICETAVNHNRVKKLCCIDGAGKHIASSSKSRLIILMSGCCIHVCSIYPTCTGGENVAANLWLFRPSHLYWINCNDSRTFLHSFPITTQIKANFTNRRSQNEINGLSEDKTSRDGETHVYHYETKPTRNSKHVQDDNLLIVFHKCYIAMYKSTNGHQGKCNSLWLM